MKDSIERKNKEDNTERVARVHRKNKAANDSTKMKNVDVITSEREKQGAKKINDA